MESPAAAIRGQVVIEGSVVDDDSMMPIRGRCHVCYTDDKNTATMVICCVVCKVAVHKLDVHLAPAGYSLLGTQSVVRKLLMLRSGLLIGSLYARMPHAAAKQEHLTPGCLGGHALHGH